MRVDDQLYKAFLEEMHELEAFRMAYATAHPSTPLDRDDPDVKRIIEALAFFAARARNAGLRNIEASRRRIFQQFVPYLLSPLPAMGMLQAVPTGQLSEIVALPSGSEMALSLENGQTALFRTLADLRALPLFLGRVETLLLPRGGWRVTLPFSVPYPRNDDIDELCLHINHLDDFLASLRVCDALERHLVKASVSFEERVDESTRGAPCEVSFGLPEKAFEEATDPHPLQRERVYFHFPRAALYIRARVPAPPRNWSHFTLCLDLDAKWPKTLRLTRDVFKLFAVPIVNLQRALASPILCDGTKDRYPLRHPALQRRFALHSVRGVYAIEEGAMIPLVLGTIASGTGTYEVEEETAAEGERRYWLSLHMPEAFQRPRTISVDGLWLQPWFSSFIAQQLHVAPYRSVCPGLKWELLGEVVSHRPSAFGDNMESFLHLFVLQNKRVMNRDDVDALLETLGSVWTGPFAKVRDKLRGVRVEEVPLKADGTAGALKLVYWLGFSPELIENEEPLLRSFIFHTSRILEAWVADATVEVRMEVKS